MHGMHAAAGGGHKTGRAGARVHVFGTHILRKGLARADYTERPVTESHQADRQRDFCRHLRRELRGPPPDEQQLGQCSGLA